MWHVGPAGVARMSTASASQSSSIDSTDSVFPLVSPLRQRRPAGARVEVDLARPQRCLDRLGVLPADHEHAPVRGILDDRRDEAVRAVAQDGRIERPNPRVERPVPGDRHQAASEVRRTGTPASAMAAFTAAMEWMSRWKIEAARTASAPPSVTAATMSAGEPAPPEAMTGTPTRDLTARRRARSKPPWVPSRSIDVSSTSPGPELDRPLDPGQAIEAGRLAAALHDDLPRPRRIGAHADVHADDDALAAEAPGARRDEPRVADGGRVDGHLVRAGAQDVAHLVGAAHAAADGERHEDPAGRPLDDVEERAASLGRGGDVEEADLVGARGRVASRQLGRVALVGEVDEPDALDDAAVADVEAGDDAAQEHQADTDAAAGSAGTP